MNEGEASDQQTEPSSAPPPEATSASQAEPGDPGPIETVPLIHEAEPGDPGPIETVELMRNLTVDQVVTREQVSPTPPPEREAESDDD